MRYMFFVLLSVLFPSSLLASEVVDVESPRGVNVRMLIKPAGNAWASVILFAGGHGVTRITDEGKLKRLKGNFLVRTSKHQAKHGIIAAIIDGPSDRPDDLHGFRDSKDHAADIAAAIAYMRNRYQLPVWLSGTSRGAVSVASAAARLQGQAAPDGIVMTSSLFESNANGASVMNVELDQIRVPVIIGHHLDDECSVTPVSGVADAKAAMQNAPIVEVLLYEGGSNLSGNVCAGKHHHGFRGIEKQVIKDLADTMKRLQGK
jgi:hypothetical protein